MRLQGATMPRKPTARAREAAQGLREMALKKQPDPWQPLPTSRDLGRQWSLCHSTIFRILIELSQEGIVWQHPNGRFFAASSRRQVSRGLPVALIGRQMKEWSHLYREILEGISEVCTASGSPLLLLSSDCLVEHLDPKSPPKFAGLKTQIQEMGRLHALVPKSCPAVIFDHAWRDDVLAKVLRPDTSDLLLMRNSEVAKMNVALPDYSAGARLALRHIVECGYEEVQIAIPFSKDPSVDQCAQEFARTFAMSGGRLRWGKPLHCETAERRWHLARSLRRASRRVALIALEDNIAMLLRQALAQASVDVPNTVGLLSLQGTTGPSSPLTRVRYDYRRLGRTAAAAVLGSQEKEQAFPPLLIKGGTTSVQPLRMRC